jgi:hypothetical protein
VHGYLFGAYSMRVKAGTKRAGGTLVTGGLSGKMKFNAIVSRSRSGSSSNSPSNPSRVASVVAEEVSSQILYRLRRAVPADTSPPGEALQLWLTA